MDAVLDQPDRPGNTGRTATQGSSRLPLEPVGFRTYGV
jgi:hypothetical protein